MPLTLDLFQKSKKEQLYDWIKQRGRVRTSDVIKFGLSIYTNRGDRYARELATEGKIWRINPFVMQTVYPHTREEGWSVYEADR